MGFTKNLIGTNESVGGINLFESIKSTQLATGATAGLMSATDKSKLDSLENYVHPDSGVVPGKYMQVDVNEQGHVVAGRELQNSTLEDYRIKDAYIDLSDNSIVLGTNRLKALTPSDKVRWEQIVDTPNTLKEFGVTDVALSDGTINIGGDLITPLTADSQLAADKITGVIDLKNIPVGAMERCVVVEDDAARFALTTNDVQKGDTVKVINPTPTMYMVVDESKLDSADGYVVYSAGNANSVPWGGITDKPDQFYTLPKADINTLGGVIIGDNITVDEDGKISTHSPYSLPQASDTVLGGVKIGENILEQPDGTINISTATTNAPGVVKIGDNINIDDDGTISTEKYQLPTATNMRLGGVRIGKYLSVDSEGLLNVNVNGVPITAEKLSLHNNDENAHASKFEAMHGQLVNVYNNVAEMKQSTRLKVGMAAKTLGYYSANDGGGAYYTIREKTDGDVDDGGSLHILNNDYVAELVIENEINFRQLGAKSVHDIGGTNFDNNDIFSKYLVVLDKTQQNIPLFIPSGIWLTSGTCLNRKNNKDGFIVRGVTSYFHTYDSMHGTILAPLNNNQQYVLKIGGNEDYTAETKTSITTNWSVKSIGITTHRADKNGTMYTTDKAAFIVDNTQFGFMDDIFLYDIDGSALCMRNSWEIESKYIMIRCKVNHNKPAFIFDTISNSSYVNSPNLTALNFEYIGFECCNGTLIEARKESGFTHSHIGNINIENSFYNAFNDNGEIANLAWDEDLSNYIKEYVFDLADMNNVIIDSVQVYKTGQVKHILNGKTYINDGLCNIHYGRNSTQVVIGTVYYSEPHVPPMILNTDANTNKQDLFNIDKLILFYGNAMTRETDRVFRMNVNYFPQVAINDILFNSVVRNRYNLMSVDKTLEAMGTRLLYTCPTSVSNAVGFNVGGGIISDDDSLSIMGLCCKRGAGAINIYIGQYISGKRLQIRAKSSKVGETPALCVMYGKNKYTTDKDVRKIISNTEFQWIEVDTSNFADEDHLIISVWANIIYDAVRFI